jgi:hypothetical protein
VFDYISKIFQEQSLLQCLRQHGTIILILDFGELKMIKRREIVAACAMAAACIAEDANASLIGQTIAVNNPIAPSIVGNASDLSSNTATISDPGTEFQLSARSINISFDFTDNELIIKNASGVAGGLSSSQYLTFSGFTGITGLRLISNTLFVSGSSFVTNYNVSFSGDSQNPIYSLNFGMSSNGFNPGTDSSAVFQICTNETPCDVPEPLSLMLLATGALALSVARCRKPKVFS